MKDGLTRSDRAFLRRTAMTGDHPWAVRLWAYIETQSEREERVRFADMKWRAAQEEIEKLRAEQDNAGFIPWRQAQDAIDERDAEIGRLQEESRLHKYDDDELERLRAEVERLTKTLETIADREGEAWANPGLVARAALEFKP